MNNFSCAEREYLGERSQRSRIPGYEAARILMTVWGCGGDQLGVVGVVVVVGKAKETRARVSRQAIRPRAALAG
jgi:hypothetical protein